MQDCHHQLVKIGRNPIYLLTAIYFIWLLAVLLLFGYTPTNDGDGYIDYALCCLKDRSPYPTLTIFRTAPFVWNSGIINTIEASLFLFGSTYPVLLLMCGLKALTALFTAMTAKELLGEKIAIVTLSLFIIYPNNWGQSTMLSSEIPSTCMAVAAIYLSVSGNSLFLSGILLALANWFRPTAIIFISTILIYLFLFRRKQFLRQASFLLSGYVVIIVLIGTSCYLRTGHFVYQARSYWFSMVDECYDEAMVAPHWNQPIWPKGTPRYIENHEKMDCFDFERIWKQRSIDWLKEHKAAYIKKIPGRLYYMYQSDNDNMSFALENKEDATQNYITVPYRHLWSEIRSLSFAQWLLIVNYLFYAIILFSALLSIVLAYRKHSFRQLFIPLFVVIAGSLVLVAVMHGETRFKDPFMPYLFMLGATGLSIKK